MSVLQQIYRHSLALLTDLYELTMAYGYWKLGLGEREAVFCLSYRNNPFDGGFSIACGLHDVIEFLQGLMFTADDTEYLASLTGADGKPLFDRGFLDHLRQMEFACDIEALPEGTVAFAHEPLIRVKGPIFQGQIIETALLTLLNFQTLVATKAARICLAAKGDPVLEFGLRRAQGIDGGITATRCAYVGGCAATSNLLAGKLFGIPVKGTHAHSWVMTFDTELEAFEAYARVMPNNCIFLVDTYNTLSGIAHAIEVGKTLHAQGHELTGIRLDSGDLAYLSIEARKMLDEAGFKHTAILASNDLDESIIASLKDQQGAKVSVWGVGTKLATAFDQPALGGVYKLTALRDSNGHWENKIKLSEQTAKISIPGMLQVRRYSEGEEFIADAIYDQNPGIAEPVKVVDPADAARQKTIPADANFEDLLVPIFRGGKLVYEMPDLNSVQRRTKQQLSYLYAGVKRFINPHRFPAGIERGLFDLRQSMIQNARSAT